MTEHLLLGLIRDILLDNDDILDYVSRNIYPELELNLEDAEFPCIIFKIIPGYYHEPSPKASFDGLQLFVYSLKSKKECYQIHNYIKTIFKTQTYYSDDSYNLNIYGSGRPDVRTDFHPKKNKNLYYLMIVYKIMSSYKN